MQGPCERMLIELEQTHGSSLISLIDRRLAGTHGPVVDWGRESPEDLLIAALKTARANRPGA